MIPWNCQYVLVSVFLNRLLNRLCLCFLFTEPVQLKKNTNRKNKKQNTWSSNPPGSILKLVSLGLSARYKVQKSVNFLDFLDGTHFKKKFLTFWFVWEIWLVENQKVKSDWSFHLIGFRKFFEVFWVPDHFRNFATLHLVSRITKFSLQSDWLIVKLRISDWSMFKIFKACAPRGCCIFF